MAANSQPVFASQFSRLYKGARWELTFGAYEGLQALAVDELQSAVQCRLPYVLEVRPSNEARPGPGRHRLLVGTPDSHPGIAALASAQRLVIPRQAQGYGIWTGPDPDAPSQRCAAIGGRDAAGVLYGVQDFNARFLGIHAPPDVPDLFLEGSPRLDGWSASEWPRLALRGIWTWGYPVYDYRRFIDNMVRLRLNALTLWNDAPPLNAASVIDYAHTHGIRISFGFHWGWGHKLDLSDPLVVDRIKEHVLSTYAEGYANLKHDGIYFQTLTETIESQLAGRPLLAHACEMVNTVARALLERHPDLKIQFGLHAISVAEHVELVRALDERIDIVWEDAGVVPFNAEPVRSADEARNLAFPAGVRDAEQTRRYALRLQAARPGLPFYMVVKGHRGLRWGREFENHGPFILGRRSPRWIRERCAERRGLRDRCWSQWLRSYPAAREFYRAAVGAARADVGAWMLVEDDGFEFDMAPDVALHAALLWNPEADLAEYTSYAASHYWEQNRLS